MRGRARISEDRFLSSSISCKALTRHGDSVITFDASSFGGFRGQMKEKRKGEAGGRRKDTHHRTWEAEHVQVWDRLHHEMLHVRSIGVG